MSGETPADHAARLDSRPYAEVGVPMLLLAEDLRGGPPGPAEPGLADALAALAQAIPDAGPARLVEVLADRRLLGPDGPVFTRLGDDG